MNRTSTPESASATPDDGAPVSEPTADPLVALAERLQALCVPRALSVAAAESCTGGLVAHLITEVDGSSTYFLGGIVSYSDQAKLDLLEVPAEVLAAHGAVSAQVARAMADGARRRFGSSLAVSVTGIAGPGGGSDEKPVGLTYVAAADERGVEVRRFNWTGDRSANKRESARAGLELLVERAEQAGT
jgi:PncC family amidohydrolase